MKERYRGRKDDHELLGWIEKEHEIDFRISNIFVNNKNNLLN